MGETWFDLSCRKCSWRNLCGASAIVDWLLRARLIRPTAERDKEVTQELFLHSGDKFRCPECGASGLVVSVSEGEGGSQSWEDGELWGEGRRCEECGRTIDAERLEAFPEGRLCVDCQRKVESGDLGGIADYCPRCGNIMVLRRSGGEGLTRNKLVCPACRR